MDSAVTHNALFSYLFPSGFKLRLDQTDHLSILRQKILHRKQNLRQRDKRYINRRKCCQLVNILRHNITDIRLFHADYPLVIAKLPRKLSMSDIDCVDFCRSVLQHTICKSAGRRADIHADFARQCDREFLHCLFQLQTAAAHIRQSFPLYLDHRVHWKCRPSLIFFVAIYIYNSRHDDCFCFLSRRRQSFLHKQYIQPLFLLLLHRSSSILFLFQMFLITRYNLFCQSLCIDLHMVP